MKSIKILSALAAFCIAAGPVSDCGSIKPVWAAYAKNEEPGADAGIPDALVYGNYEYSELDNGTVKLERYLGTDEKVVLPDKIKGKKVSTIGGNTFRKCAIVKEVVIPSGVTSIEDCAFLECSSLQKVTIGENVASIGASVFSKCTSLKKVEMQTTKLKNVEMRAFAECTSLTGIALPKSVRIIGEDAFYGCRSMETFTIPAGVKNIEDSAFYGCSSLKKVVIGKETVNIGATVFYKCLNLGTIVIKSKKLATVSGNAFAGMKSKVKIKVPKDKLEAYKKLLKGKGLQVYQMKPV